MLQLAELSAIHGDVQTMVEQGADLMNALTADANRYHSLAAMSPGAECFHTAWDAFIATVYRAHDINMKASTSLKRIRQRRWSCLNWDSVIPGS